MSNRILSHRAPYLAAALSLALVAGGLVTPVVAQTAAPPQQGSLVRGLPDFTDLVEHVGPAVVNIRTTERVRAGSADGMVDEEMQEFFRRFFGIPMPNTPRPSPRQNKPTPQPEQEVPRGVGSGFIISSDGYVMTNAHVVDGADEVAVTLPDKREFKARIVGADKRTDVALVKIEGAGLPVVRIGDASRLRVGEWVVAIGSPFGL
ncbi:MAG TPA: trypsin-like peptidase domain-containing protein, partial [Ottowia sp.]|nr:trypsin-like peptidase domain-containing protein [Ottowia sp.]